MLSKTVLLWASAAIAAPLAPRGAGLGEQCHTRAPLFGPACNPGLLCWAPGVGSVGGLGTCVDFSLAAREEAEPTEVAERDIAAPLASRDAGLGEPCHPRAGPACNEGLFCLYSSSAGGLGTCVGLDLPVLEETEPTEVAERDIAAPLATRGAGVGEQCHTRAPLFGPACNPGLLCWSPGVGSIGGLGTCVDFSLAARAIDEIAAETEPTEMAERDIAAPLATRGAGVGEQCHTRAPLFGPACNEGLFCWSRGSIGTNGSLGTCVDFGLAARAIDDIAAKAEPTEATERDIAARAF